MKMISISTVVIATLLIVGVSLSPMSHEQGGPKLAVESRHAPKDGGDFHPLGRPQMSILPFEDQAGWPRAFCGGIYRATKLPGRVYPFRFRSPSASSFTNVQLTTCDAARPLDTWLILYRPQSGTFLRVWDCDDCDGSCQRQTVQSFTIGSTEDLRRGRTTRIQYLQQSTEYIIGMHSYQGVGGEFSLRIICSGGSGSATTTSTSTPSVTTTTTSAISTTQSQATTTTFAATTTTTPPPQSTVTTGNCPVSRIRRPWRSLTTQEKNLYVSGFLQLRQNGVLTSFRNEHWTGAAIGHGTILFLPWHRQFIFEFEAQMRLLGGAYACFVLPYWDWTYVIDTATPITQLPMWNELGGLGFSANQGAFANYRDSDNAPLRRVMDDTTSLRASNVFLTSMLNTNMQYDRFYIDLEGDQHGAAHVTVDQGQLRRVRTATDDPVFFMLHAMVDLVWQLRQECFPNRLTEPDYPSGRNRIMPFTTLIADGRLSTGNMRPVDVFDSVNSLGVDYDATALIQRARGQGMRFVNCQGSRFATAAAADYGLLPKSILYDLDADKKCAFRRCRATEGICEYTEPLETCRGRGKLSISLKQLLNKRGVRGNACVMAKRKRAYQFYKSANLLREMCDGLADNVCDYL